jgi:hypothetical protein
MSVGFYPLQAGAEAFDDPLHVLILGTRRAPVENR